MSTLATLRQCMACATRGRSLRDRWLAFLLAGVGVMGAHRAGLQRLYLRLINLCVEKGVVRLQISLFGKPTDVELRAGNEADYLVACEFVHGGYERPDFEPEIVVDAGANIGLFAIHAGRLFPASRIVCYEPDPDNFSLLERNLELNGIKAELHRAGVWSSKCTLYYHPRDAHTGFVDDQPPGVEIPCETPIIPPRCWLKIDVEGAEHEVLPALLTRGDRPEFISMEIHHHATRGAALLNLLRENGYTILGGDDPNIDCTVISAKKSR